MAQILKEIRRFLHPHYIFNILLSVTFFFLKVTAPFCYMLFDDCEIELREWELLTFLGCIIVMKNRKQASLLIYVGTVCMFSKILNAFLFTRQNPLYGGVYVIFCLLHLVFLPEPAYEGPDYVTYFRGSSLEEELNRDKRVLWLIEFYASWSPTCVNFASIFAQMSAKYTLDNFKFGKLDVTRFPDIAKKYQIDTSSWSKQLPTLILFEAAKETERRPLIDSKGRVVHKFVFSQENIVREFNLNELHLQRKKQPLPKRRETKPDETDKEKSE